MIPGFYSLWVCVALGARVGTPGRWGSDGLLVTPRGTETIEILPPPEVLELLRPPDGTVVAQAARVVEGLPE